MSEGEERMRGTRVSDSSRIRSSAVGAKRSGLDSVDIDLGHEAEGEWGAGRGTTPRTFDRVRFRDNGVGRDRKLCRVTEIAGLRKRKPRRREMEKREKLDRWGRGNRKAASVRACVRA